VKRTLLIAKRECFAFFVSPIAWVVLTSWLVWSGLTYFFLCKYAAESVGAPGGGPDPLAAFFGGTMLFYIPLLFFVPVLTMRLLAGERRAGTLEPLLTAPVSATEVVLGKYLASLVFWVTLWVPSLVYVWITSRYGSVDWGVVGASYLGIFGIGLYYMAIGLYASARSSSEIVAAMLGFGGIGLLFALGIGQFMFAGSEYEEVFQYLSVLGHMENFARGVVDSRFLIFDVSIATLGVYFAIRTVELRRGAE
jgi:ABC-2 type transport system permease protein